MCCPLSITFVAGLHMFLFSGPARAALDGSKAAASVADAFAYASYVKACCRAFLAGLIVGLGLLVQSDRADAQGRTDGGSTTSPPDKVTLPPSVEEQLNLQQTIAAELSEKIRSLQAELAQAHSTRQQAIADAADLRSKLQALEQTLKDGAVYLELERARAQIAQEALAAQRFKLEQLEARFAEEGDPRGSRDTAGAVPPTPELVTPRTPIVTGGIGKGPKIVAPRRTRKVRGHPAASSEADRCVQRLMRGELSYGTGRPWYKNNALALCRGSSSAGRTLACFSTRLASTRDWRDAIADCQAR